MTTIETWMPEARHFAAQCWCDEETKSTKMDTVLAEAVARRIAAWMETAAQNQRNCDYLRGLLVRCGNALGEPAFTCDDGSKSEDVLCAKVPELVENQQEAIKRLHDCYCHSQQQVVDSQQEINRLRDLLNKARCVLVALQIVLPKNQTSGLPKLIGELETALPGKDGGK